MKQVLECFFGFNEKYFRLLKWSLTTLLGLMIIPVLLQIISRHVSFVPRYIWTEEAARFCFVWMIMIGSMIAVREGTHFDVNLFAKVQSPVINLLIKMGVLLMMLTFSVIFIIYGESFARLGHAQTSEMIGINMLSIYIAFPITGITWLLFLLEKLFLEIKRFKSCNHKECP